MSTVVCQGLQPCPDPQPVETKTLSLKLALPKPCFFESIGVARGPCSNLNQEALERESYYFHPMMKRSSSVLSDKSLELCTENLGSETGTDTIESTIFSLSSSPDLMGGDQTPVRELPKSREINLESRRVMNNKNSRNFPPPLTTISGSSSLQVRPLREGGRLVIKAVEAPSPHTYLQAERIHGRLRLCFAFDSEMGAEENEEGDMEELENEAYDEDEEEEGEEDGDDDDDDDDEEEEEKESEVCEGEDMDGNSLDVGVEMGMEKFQRPSRCKESGPAGKKSLCNWEPFWVATS